MASLFFIFITLVLAGAVLFLIIEFYVVIIGEFFGAPYVKSKKDKIKTMLELAQIKPGEKVIDLGSGDGSLVTEAAGRGAEAIGVEINPFLVWYSRWRIKKANLQDKTKIIRGDFRNFSLDQANVVFLYLWPETVAKLKEKLIRELRPGARVISNGFPLAGWHPQAAENGVFLYRRR